MSSGGFRLIAFLLSGASKIASDIASDCSSVQVHTDDGKGVNLRAKECQLLSAGAGEARQSRLPAQSAMAAANEFNAPYQPAAYMPTSRNPAAASSSAAYPLVGYQPDDEQASRRQYTPLLKPRRVTDIDVGHTVMVLRHSTHMDKTGKVRPVHRALLHGSPSTAPLALPATPLPLSRRALPNACTQVVAARNGYLIVQLDTGTSAYFRARDLEKTGGRSEPSQAELAVRPEKVPQRSGPQRRSAPSAGGAPAGGGGGTAARAPSGTARLSWRDNVQAEEEQSHAAVHEHIYERAVKMPREQLVQLVDRVESLIAQLPPEHETAKAPPTSFAGSALRMSPSADAAKELRDFQVPSYPNRLRLSHPPLPPKVIPSVPIHSLTWPPPPPSSVLRGRRAGAAASPS